MKRLKFIIGLFVAMMVMESCSDGLSDLNVNPDKSPNANPEEVLTSSMGYISYVLDAELNRRSFVWAQYWTWGPGVAIGNIERYVSDGSDYNIIWIRLYANALTDLKFVANSNSAAHAGAAKILQGYVYQSLVDHFGDVPFSEALSGELSDGSNFAPKFDDDQEIYSQLIPLIDEGIELLSGASEPMGSEDLMYDGDTDKWIKFANSLKLRILMRQSGVVDVAEDVRNLVSSGSFIESAQDIAEIRFEGSTGDENPMFARMESGVSNFYVGSNTSMDYLADNSDPRLEALYGLAVNSGTLVGIHQGSIDDEPFTASVDDYSQMTSTLYRNDAPVILMSDWEVWFLRAEAALKFGTSDDDASAFENAVAANFEYLGVANGQQFASSLDYSNSGSKIDMIAVQKWISMNGLQEDEGWIETRRFDTEANPIFSRDIFVKPTLSVLADNQHPSIWLYPANELSLNPNAPAQRDLLQKVFWDN